MRTLIIAAAAALAACTHARAPGPAGSAAESAVVVMGGTADMRAGAIAWKPICGGVAVSPSRVLTSLDCVAAPGVELVGFAVVDAWSWRHTTDAQVIAHILSTDPVERTATLMTERDIEAGPVRRASSPLKAGDRAIVARLPDRVESAVVMGDRLISTHQAACRDIVAGAGVYNERGELVGIATKGGLKVSEYVSVVEAQPSQQAVAAVAP